MGKSSLYLVSCLIAKSCLSLCDPMDCSRTPCPSPSPRVHSNSCPLNRWLSSNHLILCCPLLLLPSIFPRIRIFSNELTLHIRWAKYWSFSISISPSSEYTGLISLRIDWFDLAVQGTLKSFLQHHNSKDQFFGAQSSLWSNSHTCTWLLKKQ